MTTIKRIICILLALVIIHTVATFRSSGVRVEEYVAEGDNKRDIGDIRLALDGHGSWRHIPFLFLRYKEIGPYNFRLSFFCYDSKPYDEITISSIELRTEDNVRLELHDDQLPNTWKFQTAIYDTGNPWHKITSVRYSNTFKTKMDISFEETPRVYVTVEMTLKRGEDIIEYRLEDTFKSSKTAESMSYWGIWWDALMGI